MSDTSEHVASPWVRRARQVAALRPHEPAQRRTRIERRRQRRARWSRRILTLDVVCLIVAATVSGLAPGTTDASPAWSVVVFGGLTVAFIAARKGYRLRLEPSPVESLGLIVAATGTAATLAMALRVFLEPDPGIATEAVRLWAFSAVYLVGARTAVAVAAHRADRRGLPTLIVGAGAVGQTVARRLLDRPEMGLRPVGFLDKEPRGEDETPAGLPVLGASWDLERAVDAHDVEHVIVAFSTAPHHVLLSLVRRCRSLGVEVSLVPRLFEEISTRATVQHLGGIALLGVDQADPRGWQFEVKYALDRAVGILAVLVLSPLLLTIAALVKATSPGPILFRQPRIGLDGREFDILKFRTMKDGLPGVENDAAWAARALGVDVATAEAVVEDRRTPVGSFLRRWSLDELPQLLNIARGEMSFIGPRPERTGYVRTFEEHVYRYGDRHRVKSGLTGWAQVQGLRGETSLDDRVEWDNFYVENWSPWLDLKILLLTPPAVLGGRGAA